MQSERALDLDKAAALVMKLACARYTAQRLKCLLSDRSATMSGIECYPYEWEDERSRPFRTHVSELAEVKDAIGIQHGSKESKALAAKVRTLNAGS